MSVVEEDVELRDLQAQILEKNGCLTKIRAALRASIFLALDEDMKLSNEQPLQNLRVRSYLQTLEGRTMFCLVREFLEFFNLQFTISVYESESYLDTIGQYEGRQKLAKDLGLDLTEEPAVPLLQQVLKIAQKKSKILDINLKLNDSFNGVDSGFKKTEPYNNNHRNSNNDSEISQEKNSKNEQLENKSLNSTFNVNSPTINFSNGKKTNNGHYEDGNNKNVLHKMVLEEQKIGFEEPVSDRSADFSKIFVPEFDESNKTNNSSMGKSENFNFTYDLNIPTANISHNDESKNGTSISRTLPKFSKEDDTYEDTSSIAEDSEALIKPPIPEEVENNVPFKSTTSTINGEYDQISSKLSSPTKLDVERPKLSFQRPKANLSSLSDLPPLPLNKTRVSNDILPSMYNKDFKNKSNLKELDKMFDIEADYEADFIYNNESALKSSAVNINQSKTNITEEHLVATKTELDMLNIKNRTDPKSITKTISEVGKSLLKPIHQTNCSNSVKTGDHSNNSSISESVNSAQ